MENRDSQRHAGGMPDSQTPGQRLAKLAADELALLVRELVKARKGKDAGVHKARKALQRLRCILRLVREAQPDWHARTDAQLRRLRRRLGPLRDAAVRAELARVMLETPLEGEQRSAVEQAAAKLEAARVALWAGLPGTFWEQIERAVARHLAAFDRWPLAELDAVAILQALEKARRKTRLAAAEALGHVQRNGRHELRRQLRRYAAMRKAAAYALRQRDPGAATLVDVAREIGVEGDLWLTCTALKGAGHGAEIRVLRGALEKQRRALCKKHDGELASLRRGLLAKKQAGHVARLKQLRQARRKADREAAGGADKSRK